MSHDDPAEAWRKRFERERAARKEAETLLHAKSRELFDANRELTARAEELTLSLHRLRETQDALVQREKMAALGGLVAGVAHEINTPVGVAVTGASLSRERVADLRAAAESGRLTRGRLKELLAELDEALALVLDNLSRGASLVRSLKLVAVDQSTDDVRRAVIGELLGDVLAGLRPMLRQTRVTVEIELERGPAAPVLLAAGPLVQVLSNLLQNACIHAFRGAPDPRVLRLRVEDLGPTLRMVVSDNGVGMSPEVVARVYEPFFTTRRDEGGSGLGMHIVYNIVVSRFAGSIHVESTPGRGTAWRMELPFGTPALRRTNAP